MDYELNKNLQRIVEDMKEKLIMIEKEIAYYTMFVDRNYKFEDEDGCKETLDVINDLLCIKQRIEKVIKEIERVIP